MDPITLGFLAFLKAYDNHKKNVSAAEVLRGWDQYIASKGVVSKRVPFPAKVKEAIKDEQGYCAYWRLMADSCSGSLEVDHEYPLAQGGTNYSKNLRLVCRAHNRSKGKTLPRDYSG